MSRAARTPAARHQAHRTVVAVLRAADLLRRRTAAIVEPAGITTQQFNVLRILRGARAGGEDALPTLEVGSRMIEQTPGVTRLLDRLEAKGLVSRRRCPEDRRQHRCRITPRGLGLLAALDDPILEDSRQALRRLTARQQAALAGLLDAVGEEQGGKQGQESRRQNSESRRQKTHDTGRKTSHVIRRT
ncbi:MAG TPA: MarR family transcriptional regulator [Vicinamibacterales bacterium]|nr:MarR family transcriptional regulator [Vicinamibacterales bacterium]HPW19735.1 MarR family transcriptional regulator [Vicinamibacterales bacterium]